MSKISPKNIAEAIYEATEGKKSSDVALTLKRTAEMIKNKRLLGKSEDILNTLQKIIDEKSNTVRMKVITAKVLGNEEKKKLEHEAKEKYKASKIISEFFEKSELLGGIRIEVGDEVMDTTYKNKLNQLENFLMK